MRNPPTIAESFRQLDFHDDTLLSLRMLPSQSRSDGAGSIVEIELLQPKKRVLRFVGVANLRVAIDLDVLTENHPCNTSGAEAHTDKDAMWALMQSQVREWDVTYPAPMRSPLDSKADVMNEFVCFRVQFFGGAVEIIARWYEIESLET